MDCWRVCGIVFLRGAGIKPNAPLAGNFLLHAVFLLLCGSKTASTEANPQNLLQREVLAPLSPHTDDNMPFRVCAPKFYRTPSVFSLFHTKRLNDDI
jgi:hypothetical protein